MYIFLVPSVSCPATCRYCNGPQGRTRSMSPNLAVEAISWAYRFAKMTYGDKDTLNITFHGGEPLLPGIKFYEKLFKGWHSVSRANVRFGLQSNLWLLTEEFCDLFARYRTTIGTSLDGPPAITNAERGHSYYERCMRGVMLAKQRSIRVGCVATFTKRTAAHIDEVFAHFRDIDIEFKANAAVPRLNAMPGDEDWVLPPDDYKAMLAHLLDLYLENTDQIRIDNIDRACRALATGRADTCVFSDCLGHYLAIDPQGSIFPCMRFVGHEEYCMGKVQDKPDLQQLQRSEAWKIISHRNEEVQKECRGCTYWNICMGGCPYNWLANRCTTSWKDPYCEAYKAFYNTISQQASKELFAETNTKLLRSNRPLLGKGLLQSGPLLNIISQRVHPDGRTAAYRRIVAAAALGTNLSEEILADHLVAMGISLNTMTAKASLGELRRKLEAPDHVANDVYLHVTNYCNTCCTHCYASSKPAGLNHSIPTDEICRISLEAAQLGYRRIVLTGGEPLEHPELPKLLEKLRNIRYELGACFFVLRTGLLKPINEPLLSLLDDAVEQVVVSIDGDRAYHDSRRFPGAYDQTLKNLRTFLSMKKKCVVRLAALVPPTEEGIAQAKHVFNLADSLGIASVVVRNPKPIGRAIHWIDWEHQEFIHLPPDEVIAQGLYPRSSCGRGTNLHIETDGAIFPCYADLGNSACLGTWTSLSLADILRQSDFRTILRQNIDDIPKCRECSWRYLCGGICLAWSHAAKQQGFCYAQMCADKKTYATTLLTYCLSRLGIPVEYWNEHIAQLVPEIEVTK